jgi:hypothetical protein
MDSTRKSTRRLIHGITALAAVGLCASLTYAGEVTGTGKSLKNPDGTLNGKSSCAFSGLNDTYSGDPTIPDEDGFYRTQTWAALPKAVRDDIRANGGGPGVSCNPHRSSGGEPGEE